MNFNKHQTYSRLHNIKSDNPKYTYASFNNIEKGELKLLSLEELEDWYVLMTNRKLKLEKTIETKKTNKTLTSYKEQGYQWNLQALEKNRRFIIRARTENFLVEQEEFFDEQSEGYIYILKEEFYNTYKIGRSKHPYKRTQLFASQPPYDHEIIYILKVDDDKYFEKHYHRLFKNKRLKGEYFKLSKEDLKEFNESPFKIYKNPELF